MKALGITTLPKPGALIDSIQLLDLPELFPKKQEVVIKVHATSVNIDDMRIAEGTAAGGVPVGPNPKPTLPVIPGMDVSGVVVKVGSKVTNFKPGDEVFGICDSRKRNGAWAEYCCANEAHLVLKPKKWSFQEAAGVGVVANVTCFSVNAAKVKQGDRCLVIGASGGIGSTMVKILCSRGAEVTGVCSTKNMEHVRKLGAKRVIDYTKENFADVLTVEISPKLDFVFDFVGGKKSEKDALKVLNKKGSFITSVGPVYFIGDKKLGIVKLLQVFTYVFLRMLMSNIGGPRYIMASPTQKTYKKLIPELVQKNILPPIDHKIAFDINALKEAICYVSSHRAKGKVIMSINKEKTNS